MGAAGDLVVVGFVCLVALFLEIDARRRPPRHPNATTVPPAPRGLMWQPLATATCIYCRRERPLSELREFECLSLQGYVCARRCETTKAARLE